MVIFSGWPVVRSIHPYKTPRIHLYFCQDGRLLEFVRTCTYVQNQHSMCEILWAHSCFLKFAKASQQTLSEIGMVVNGLVRTLQIWYIF